jgi:hypothetical protein
MTAKKLDVTFGPSAANRLRSMVPIHAGLLSRVQPENGRYGSAMEIAFATAWLNCLPAISGFRQNREKHAAPIVECGHGIRPSPRSIIIWY